MNLIPASQTYRKWSEICKNKAVVEKTYLCYPSFKGESTSPDSGEEPETRLFHHIVIRC